MKKILLSIVAVVAIVAMGSCSTKVSTTRDLAYEAYCDSIYEADPDYYLDVLCETDEYCIYIEQNGQWWGGGLSWVSVSSPY